ncbi:hypothetical protein NKR23_g4363 [Pleurostoma richardsiae]|uniref:Uncharacterized protein n=1 Tax=Pleurostoma richardsiae TaxID=41990 RepID=A0AA38RVT1_9PEZI|nr:hypothetical protein NKR23_g4363 [Pleurostoma richardsiae]
MSGTAPSQDSHAGHSRDLEQESLDSHQHGQATNIIDETSDTYGTKRPDADVGGNAELHGEALKDRIDDAVPKGPKKADPSSGGRVMVGEQGDLHDLAAAKQP